MSCKKSNLSLQSGGGETEERKQTGAHRRAKLGSTVASLLSRAALASRGSRTTPGGRRRTAAAGAGGNNACGGGVTTVTASGASRGCGARAGGCGSSVAVPMRRRLGGAGAGRAVGDVLAAQAVERVAVDVLADNTERWVGGVRESVLKGVPPDMVLVLELAGDLLPVLLSVLGRGDTATLGLAGDGPACHALLARCVSTVCRFASYQSP